jgi:putative hydrolase of the HAD superfamily
VKPAIIFDLDDTLYPEADFCAQAFGSAAGLLEERGVGRRDQLERTLLGLHLEDRERVFERAAGACGYSRQWVPDLVAAYRATRPSLRPWPGVLEMLDRLRGRWRLGILTDGHAAVQRAKLRALGLEARVNAVVVGAELGAWKPSPHGVRECLRLLGSEPGAAVLVGDNPGRDLLAARSADVAAWRVRHPAGYFARVPTPPGLAGGELEDVCALEGVLQEATRNPEVAPTFLCSQPVTEIDLHPGRSAGTGERRSRALAGAPAGARTRNLELKRRHGVGGRAGVRPDSGDGSSRTSPSAPSSTRPSIG